VSGAAVAEAYRDGIRANLTKLGRSTRRLPPINARPALATVSNPLQEIITKVHRNFLKTEPE
jgi:hypothetical protein